MIKRLLIVCCTVITLSPVTGFSKKIHIGGLFDKDDPCLTAFESSVTAVNNLRSRTDDLPNIFFGTNIQEIDNDLFETQRSVCRVLRSRVAAIFGPSDRVSAEHVQSICETVDMPNVVARWEMEPARMKAFNLYPHAETLAKAFLRIVRDFHWKTYTILYDTSDGLVRMSELLKKWDPNGYVVTIRHLGNGTDFRDLLLKIKKTKELNIVIDCSYDILEIVLRQCLQVGLLSDRYSVIVTNLDLHTIDLDPYRYSGVNLTGVRLVDVDFPDPYETLDPFLDSMGLESLTQLRVEPALMYDAVQFFARALKRSADVINGNVETLECNGLDYWEYGTMLSNYIRTTEMRGLTGLVKFHTNGFRSDFQLDILSLRPEGLTKIAVYNSTSGIDWPRTVSLADSTDLHNNTFRVLISLVPPYNMLTESLATRSGNDRYEGFAIDIIHEISKKLHFNYTFIETDPVYGKKIDNDTHKWSGMLGKIMDGEADLAISDLTITAERERVVDFTMPFMNLGISILYKKPTKAAPSLFSFLSPFSIKVWLYLMGSYIFCSLLLFIIGRISPKEWTNPYPCIEEPEQLENQFTLKNSLWFMIGAIMQQGSEIAPIGISTRMLASSWWFFCLIIVSSYTANLAAFLVVETTVKPIKSAEDLAELNGAIKYGAKRDGATYNFFKTSAQTSEYKTYEKMFRYMEANADEVMTDTNEEGRDKVLDPNQNYAFLMESSSIQYIVQRECNLSQIGGLLDNKGYGIAMRKNWTYRHQFNEAVLELQESGVISQLQKKWWEQKRGGGRCQGDILSPASKLTLDHVGGVFVVLWIGVGFAIPFAFCELFWKIVCNTYKENLSFKDEFVEQMTSIIKSKSSVKPVRRRNKSLQIMDASMRGSTPSILRP